MKSLRYLLFFIFSQYSIYSFGQDFEPLSGPQGVSILDMCISSDNHIFISVSDRGIFRSTDNGASWQPFMNGIAPGVATPNQLTPAPNGEVYCISNEVFYRLPAGESTWTSKFIPELDRSCRISVNPDGKIFVSLKNLRIFLANSGTDLFTEIAELPGFYYFTELVSFGNNLNFGFYNYLDELYLFSDDGSSFEEVTPNFQPYEDIQSLHQTQDGRLIMATKYKVWTSDDNGQTWKPTVVHPDYLPIFSGSLAPNGEYYLLTGEGSYFSSDQGESFEKMTDVPFKYRILHNSSGLEFSSDGHSYLYSYNNYFFHSWDNNISWERLDEKFDYPTTLGMTESPENEHFIYTSKIDGIEISEDGGYTWEIYNDSNQPFNDIAIHPNGDYFAVSGYEIFHSTDQGQNWNNITPDSPYGQTSRLSITPQGTLLVSDREYLLRSEDLGQTWDMLLFSDNPLNFPPTYHPIGDIYMNSYGAIWRSSDDGKNWIKIIQNVQPIHAPEICPNGDVYIPVVDPNPLGTPSYQVIKLINNGNTPQDFDPPFWPYYDTKVKCDCGNNVFIANAREVFVSSDGGEVWDNIFEDDDENGNITFLYFDSENYLFMGFRNQLPVKSIEPTCDFVDDVFESEKEKVQVKISPNPFEESTHFEIQNDPYQEYTLHIFDILGKKMKTAVFQSNTFTLHKDDLQTGLYTYQIVSQNQILKTGKLIIK